MRRFALCLATGIVMAVAGLTTAQAAGQHAPHTMVTSGDLEWVPSPTLPQGAMVAILHGDPTKEGPFVLRVKMPDGFTIPPHWHPTDENLTTLQGSFLIGTGDTFDDAALETLDVGDFGFMSAKTTHFARTKGETVVQVHATGPFTIHYVNPDDDPRPTASR